MPFHVAIDSQDNKTLQLSGEGHTNAGELAFEVDALHPVTLGSIAAVQAFIAEVTPAAPGGKP